MRWRILGQCLFVRSGTDWRGGCGNHSSAGLLDHWVIAAGSVGRSSLTHISDSLGWLQPPGGPPAQILSAYPSVLSNMSKFDMCYDVEQIGKHCLRGQITCLKCPFYLELEPGSREVIAPWSDIPLFHCRKSKCRCILCAFWRSWIVSLPGGSFPSSYFLLSSLF